ncbi:ABC transporter substrate-binding protein [Salidesulfovibrio brasiliensis]|uniref:ABC transporter substrate-binding protein n=1 Tax=Salidesulfovibrio brasiliensis TaxID=221711 RepID=UPI0006D2BA59|nr:MetQ/NlpA family ABC transporter substrate-binding protein [Salidesulfovibrio brasiliensis]
MKFRFLLLALTLMLAVPQGAAAANSKIRFGILPVLDTLPLQVAKAEKLFEKNAIEVELIPFSSALERDTALKAGQLDGFFGDLVATFMLIDKGAPMLIATTSYSTTPGQPMFGIVSSPEESGKGLSNLEGASIAISRSTIIEFLLDKIMERNELPKDYFNRVEIKKIPIRLQMLLSDEIDLALLPEPLMSLTRFKGGCIVVTAENLGIPLTVLNLHRRYFEGKGKDYMRFMSAYVEALEMLKKNPETYRDLMAKTCRIPPPLAKDFPIYSFPMPSLPSAEQLNEVQDWMIGHELLEKRIPRDWAVSPIAP